LQLLLSTMSRKNDVVQAGFLQTAECRRRREAPSPLDPAAWPPLLFKGLIESESFPRSSMKLVAYGVACLVVPGLWCVTCPVRTCPVRHTMDRFVLVERATLSSTW